MPLYDVTNICTNISTNTAKRHPAWVKGSRDVIFRRLLQTKRGVSNFQQERGSSPRPFHGGGVEFPDLATVHGAGVEFSDLATVHGGGVAGSAWALLEGQLVSARPTGQCAHPKTEVALEGRQRTGLALARARLWPAAWAMRARNWRGSA